MADTQSSVNDHERHFLQRIILCGFIAVLLDPECDESATTGSLLCPVPGHKMQPEQLICWGTS
tara:strand:+ start:541 stop:729 length:189 start_codon:yes stop_codon:yes gene_type:complete